MNILIVKTSSLGDVIHMLPAITDAVRAIPSLNVDWLIEEPFAPHPGLAPCRPKRHFHRYAPLEKKSRPSDDMAGNQGSLPNTAQKKLRSDHRQPRPTEKRHLDSYGQRRSCRIRPSKHSRTTGLAFLRQGPQGISPTPCHSTEPATSGFGFRLPPTDRRA